MPTFQSFTAFERELGKLAKDLDDATKRRITREMGEKAQQIARATASADLGGDPKFSGWAPTLDTQLKAGRDGSTILMPTRSGAGPWTVAEQGRNQGNAGGFSGPGINTKTGKTSRTKSGGVRKVRARASKRWNGTTDPKHTATEAGKRMESELPPIAERGVRKVIVRHFDVT